MNKIYKTLLAFAVAVPAALLTGCVEETFPTTAITQDQLNEIPGTADTYANGMPAFMNNVFVLSMYGVERHWDFGYPSMMWIRECMTGDVPVVSSDYDQFSWWRNDLYQGSEYIFAQYMWTYYYKLVQTANLALEAIEDDVNDKHLQTLRGYAYAYRALIYLDMARQWEFLPNDGTSQVNKEGNDVLGLTVPIVTEEITEELARNNPRATHEEMFNFILNDLKMAETRVGLEARKNKTFPDLATVYGLFARLYMWDEDYTEAANYARKAIDTSGAKPLSAEEYTSTENGFNTLTPSAVMFGQQFVTEDDAVQTGIVNWTSWASNEFTEGYSAYGPYVMIDANLYKSMPDDDIRKLLFVAPKGSALEGQELWIDKSAMFTGDGQPINLPEYASLKVRPGHGEMQDYLVACAVGIPLMRVEEMIFIEAEAIAHSNPLRGRELMENFVKQNRCPSYSMLGTTTDQVVDEIFQQKRIEFYLEGLIFFDYKRLDKPVVRNYKGSNFYEQCRFTTTTRPAWMNWCITRGEENGNPALKGWNNPDPSAVYADQIEPEE